MKDDDRGRSPAPPKKPYRSPVVHVYGNIRAITQAVGTTGAADGGMMAGMRKTR
jgi:hypothetical protein